MKRPAQRAGGYKSCLCGDCSDGFVGARQEPTGANETNLLDDQRVCESLVGESSLQRPGADTYLPRNLFNQGTTVRQQPVDYRPNLGYGYRFTQFSLPTWLQEDRLGVIRPLSGQLIPIACHITTVLVFESNGHRCRYLLNNHQAHPHVGTCSSQGASVLPVYQFHGKLRYARCADARAVPAPCEAA